MPKNNKLITKVIGITNDPKEGMRLLPAKKGTCPECAVAHDPTQPHNQQSIYYQYHFYADHQRFPNWGDAMAHCSKEVQEVWKQELLKAGVKEEAFKVVKDGKG
jgi:protein-disulfide isomerase